MMDMIERVARAIAAADGMDYMEDHARYDRRAKAAIEAMRRLPAAHFLEVFGLEQEPAINPQTPP